MSSFPVARTSARALQAINRFYVRSYHRLDVIAPCQFPASGPAIVVCNHTSGLDPNLIQSCCPRLITWMMAREYYEQPIVRSLLDLVGIIPVSRNGRDMPAMRAAMRTLHDGKLLGIFPEGRIEPSHDLLPFQTGVALIAIKSGAPVYPIYLDGSQRGSEILHTLVHPQVATIAFGPAIDLNRNTDNLESVTEKIQAAVDSLRQITSKARRQRYF